MLPMEQILSFRVDLFQTGSGVQQIQQEVTKVISNVGKGTKFIQSL